MILQGQRTYRKQLYSLLSIPTTVTLIDFYNNTYILFRLKVGNVQYYLIYAKYVTIVYATFVY